MRQLVERQQVSDFHDDEEVKRTCFAWELRGLAGSLHTIPNRDRSQRWRIAVSGIDAAIK